MKKYFYLLFAILVLIFFAYHSKNFRIDASSDTLIAKNDKDFEFFNYYNSIFPSRNFLVLAIESDNVIDEKYIKVLDKLSNKIEKLNQVESVFSINKAPILFLNNTKINQLASEKIETITNTKYKIQNVINEFSNNSIYKNQIISQNKKISSIIIYLKKNDDYSKIKKEILTSNNRDLKKQYIKIKEKINKNRNNLIKDIREIIKKSDQEYKYFLGGIDMIADDVISYVKNDIFVFSISILIIVIFVLYIIFRNTKWIFLCLFSSCYAVISMFGLISLLNIEVTAISSNFASLMFILSISMNIHIINYYKQNFINNNDYIFLTLKKMFWPCIYTILTTIVAFASLIISDIKPVEDFGYIMIFSLIIIFICSFTILPLLISFFPNPRKSESLKLTILNFFCLVAYKYKINIIIINLFIFIISIFGITKLNVENSFINYFKKNTEIYRGMELIDKNLGGTTPLDVIISFKDDIETLNLIENDKRNNDVLEEDLLDEDLLDEDLLDEDLFINDNINLIWFSKEKLNIIDEIHQYLENRDEIGKVTSINSLIELGNKLNQIPLTMFELSILNKEIPSNYKKDLIDPYLSIDNNMIKISARIMDSKDINRNQLINDIKNYLNNYNTSINYKVNGLLVLYNNMLQSLFSSQIKSLGLVLFSIFLMFIILFQSFKLSILGIIPNLFASSLILGLIGILNIPLDIMTITIAAITIGIAVDNTIHYLYRYKENSKNNMNSKEIIEITHKKVGYAILTTSLTISFGFSVLALSNFIPTILFGIFTSLAMVVAMLGVLITLPSLLNKYS